MIWSWVNEFRKIQHKDTNTSLAFFVHAMINRPKGLFDNFRILPIVPRKLVTMGFKI